jgi:dehydrogenase/reductase SDR family member 7B
MYNFNDKVVWITGASSGIGEALAKALAAKGATLILSARNENKLLELKQQLNRDDKKTMILPLDLENTSHASQLTKQVLERFGRIDILINNGGISQRSFASETPLDIDRKIMEVNFFGTIALTKSVLPAMIAQKQGKIIVISSIAGKFGFYFRSAYSASKHALHGFFESMRMELTKENIDVLLVCPGKVKTNISVNALKSDGTQHNQMDSSQEKGVSATYCAHQILKAIEQNKEEIFIGGKELRAVWLKRFFPSLFSILIKKQKPE